MSKLDNEKDMHIEHLTSASDYQPGHTIEASGHLQRHLGNRQIQFIAIGGSIGTALFISIGSGLTAGGPGSLLTAFMVQCVMMAAVNNCMAEMAVYMPVSGSFVRMAGKWVDEAMGFMLGWNLFLYEAFLIPFEISALNLAITFWSDKVPIPAISCGCILIYGFVNFFGVKYFGETEFWLSSGKIMLILIVFSFTFITMVGGNPQHDAYGFRYWSQPGAFAELYTTGALGRFEGWLGALWVAAFTICGPEYIAMLAGETQRPRTYLKAAFKTTYWRFGFFFLGSALAVGVVLPFNDAKLVNGHAAMSNLGISVLPHIVNALLISSIFSAGNAYVFTASRTLYALSLEGHAPRFLRKCTKSGNPIWCIGISMLFPLLSLLQIGGGTASVVTMLVSLVQAAQMINYVCMCVTYIFFYRAVKAQHIDRSTFAYRGWFQPWSSYVAAVWMLCLVGVYGYSTFLPGNFTVKGLFSYYTMVFMAIVTFTGWKLVKRTKVIKPQDADFGWEKPAIDLYENTFEDVSLGFKTEVMQLFGLRKNKTESSTEI